MAEAVRELYEWHAESVASPGPGCLEGLLKAGANSQASTFLPRADVILRFSGNCSLAKQLPAWHSADSIVRRTIVRGNAAHGTWLSQHSPCSAQAAFYIADFFPGGLIGLFALQVCLHRIHLSSRVGSCWKQFKPNALHEGDLKRDGTSLGRLRTIFAYSSQVSSSAKRNITERP